MSRNFDPLAERLLVHWNVRKYSSYLQGELWHPRSLFFWAQGMASRVSRLPPAPSTATTIHLIPTSGKANTNNNAHKMPANVLSEGVTGKQQNSLAKIGPFYRRKNSLLEVLGQRWVCAKIHSFCLVWWTKMTTVPHISAIKTWTRKDQKELIIGSINCDRPFIRIAIKITFTVKGLMLSYQDFHTMVKTGIFVSKRALMEPFWQLNFTERGLVTHVSIVLCCCLSKY